MGIEKFDDMAWHFESDNFPRELPSEAAATHVGAFMAWAVFRRLASAQYQRDNAQEIESLQAREMTPGRFVMVANDGSLVDDDFGELGATFAAENYDHYLQACDSLRGDNLPSVYHLPDDWQTFELLAGIIEALFQQWRETSASEGAE